MKPALATAAMITLSFCAALAAAQAIKDPMRPPPGIGAAVEPPPTQQGAVTGPVLQSVILSPTRRAAVISGQVVERGGHYGDAVLAEVAQDHVVLRRASGTQVLKLYPGMEKQLPAKAEKKG